jgi:hypothetical protein
VTAMSRIPVGAKALREAARVAEEITRSLMMSLRTAGLGCELAYAQVNLGRNRFVLVKRFLILSVQLSLRRCDHPGTNLMVQITNELCLSLTSDQTCHSAAAADSTCTRTIRSICPGLLYARRPLTVPSCQGLRRDNFQNRWQIRSSWLC